MPRELDALARFSQQKYRCFFVKLYGWFQGQNTLFIATEYCQYEDLRSYLEKTGKIPEAQAQEISWQVLQGIRFMHQNNFAHRGLKPANILIKSKPPNEKWHVKICDLGLSKRVGAETASTTAKGTPGFMPPEAIPGFGPNTRKFNPFPADMWCLGETIFYMLTKKTTFSNNALVLLAYQKGVVAFPIELLEGFQSSRDLVPFVQRLMAPAPKDRLTAEQAITNTWINGPLGHYPELMGTETAGLDQRRQAEPEQMSHIPLVQREVANVWAPYQQHAFIAPGSTSNAVQMLPTTFTQAKPLGGWVPHPQQIYLTPEPYGTIGQRLPTLLEYEEPSGVWTTTQPYPPESISPPRPDSVSQQTIPIFPVQELWERYEAAPPYRQETVIPPGPMSNAAQEAQPIQPPSPYSSEWLSINGTVLAQSCQPEKKSQPSLLDHPQQVIKSREASIPTPQYEMSRDSLADPQHMRLSYRLPIGMGKGAIRRDGNWVVMG